jgi:L-alanine-DL-glutamate epimerase-like enolase superfamily enzyme
MQIRDVKAYPLAYPEPHYNGIERYITLALVESDNGLVGWGECISQFPEATLATKTVIERGFAPMLVGQDASDVGASGAGCSIAFGGTGRKALRCLESVPWTWRSGI